jgi:hypothetical protein
MNCANRTILCLLLFGLSVSGPLEGQRANKRPKIEILREIDLEEGRQRLSDFRQMWVIGDLSLHYSLQFIPRRGKRQEIKGTLWGTNGVDGPISLIQIFGDPVTRLYLKSGPFASVSKMQDDASTWNEVAVSDWFATVDDQVTLTAFDLMMPFIYWPDWTYEGVTKVNSRVAHAFLMKAPDVLKGNPLGLHGVVVFLDESFNALLKAEYVSEDAVVLKTLKLIDIKKVDGLWLPKTFDFLDEATRDKTRLRIQEAALNLDFSDHPLGQGVMPQSVPEIPLSRFKEVR